MNQNLRPFHTFHLPVSANKIIPIHTQSELITEWQTAKNIGEPILLLGQGSNVLFVESFSGTVLINQFKGIEHTEDENFHYLKVAGGEIWHELVQWTLSQNMAGLENLALIPGCVGSAPIQNIGAYGVEFERFCDFVEAINLRSGKTVKLSKEQCQFGYRESIFKHEYKDEYAIVSVGLRLAKKWQPTLTYGSLTQFDPATVTAQQIFDEVCAVRSAKLPHPDQFGNAGSFFKNPIIPFAKFSALLTAYPNIPHYPQADGSVKIPAGWLIDQCQLKGYQIGGAAVHTQQALVLINKDNATGKDVVQLAKTVRQKVRKKFGVDIHPEVRFMGQSGEIDSEEITR
ncbi:UDP-N-acetylmuramate dehydrogenase [Otariodibacter oris]|uniref:UDP-N-acetylenolpyruvoylglucosamine reductase n=1 Tax=Otariodibacter oris TaxID=1032623 RepID=A0A420XEE8_9PAST|nr:UDP-N-acetylmuramate dehydrogenase [Otariodibacter oris]QGM80202.1 UDP-N-acetylenolpyruvoylglucosamine reductase [Otariodibacter oris]RKR70608.1 UDP-N-acetylmuramate dehydrogenase [Otariodibacter oris]